MRILRLITLNLSAWQLKRTQKEAEGKPMNASSVPSAELQQKMFDIARQMLTLLEVTVKESSEIDLSVVQVCAHGFLH